MSLDWAILAAEFRAFDDDFKRNAMRRCGIGFCWDYPSSNNEKGRPKRPFVLGLWTCVSLLFDSQTTVQKRFCVLSKRIKLLRAPEDRDENMRFLVGRGFPMGREEGFGKGNA